MALFSKRNLNKSENIFTLNHKTYGFTELLTIEYLFFEDHLKIEIQNGTDPKEHCFIESKYILTLINDLKNRSNSKFSNKINSEFLQLRKITDAGLVEIRIMNNTNTNVYFVFTIKNEKELNAIINYLEKYI